MLEEVSAVVLIIAAVVGLAVFIFWVWSIIDIATGRFEGMLQVVWILIVVFLGPLGSIIYAVLGRNQRMSS